MKKQLVLCAAGFLVAAISISATAATAGETELFRDPTKSLDDRVQDLIARLTLEEKAMLLNHKGTTVQRFDIRADQWNQCLNGVKWDRPTTLLQRHQRHAQQYQSMAAYGRAQERMAA